MGQPLNLSWCVVDGTLQWPNLGCKSWERSFVSAIGDPGSVSRSQIQGLGTCIETHTHLDYFYVTLLTFNKSY